MPAPDIISHCESIKFSATPNSILFNIRHFFLLPYPNYNNFRCVRDDQRSFALGIQWIKVRLFGTIPAPMIFGKLIDDTCVLWKETCDEDGSGVGACLVYDNYNMSK